MLVRAHVQTPLLKDTFVFPLHNKEATIEWLLDEIHKRYEKWHYFKVYEFTLSDRDGESLDKSQKVLETLHPPGAPSAKEIKVHFKESNLSIEKRKEDQRREAEERRRLEREARRKRLLRLKRIRELKLIGNCWELDGYSNFLDVPLEENGLVVENKGSLDQWCSIRYIHPIIASNKQYFYSILIEDLPETTNTWQCCIGCVPMTFKPDADRHWVGAQHSWAYIGGTGGKCHNSGKSSQYGDTYGKGDIVGVLLDFSASTIEFFKNGKSQGIAYENLKGPVYPAVSLTSKGCKMRFLDQVTTEPEKLKNTLSPAVLQLMKANIETEKIRRQRWHEVTSKDYMQDQVEQWQKKHINSWSGMFSLGCDEAMFYPFDESSHLKTVVNHGSDNKWRVARSVGAYSTGVKAFEVEILRDDKSSNTWRMCIGVVPVNFVSTSDRIWVGAQASWGYISGTGGKCFNSGQSTAYGERYTTGDIVSVLMDLDGHKLEFFKNGESQGIAYDSFGGPVYAAASTTAENTCMRILDCSPERVAQLVKAGIQKRLQLSNIMEKFGNTWDVQRKCADMKLSDDRLVVENTGSNQKWRACASALPYQSGRRYFEVKVLACPETTNTWRITVGVVNKEFSFTHKKLWIGAQHSWSYIMGTGGKCYNSGKSEKFGSAFEIGDRVGVLMDFDNHTLEFFYNDTPQGEAYNNLYGPVYAAVAMTATGAKVELNALAENEKMDDLFLFR